MNKMIICTVGTSISNGCKSQRELLSNKSSWTDSVDFFENEIKSRINGVPEEKFRSISAEINSIDRLNISPNDKIILLSSDNAPGKACSNCLKDLIIEHYKIERDNVKIERIEGLQVYDSGLLKRVGLKNFISTSLKYIADKSLSYQYDIIINPTGGFKGVLPFLTILGMLYAKKTIYIFEFSEELIYLPPLPFSFDLNIFNRVRPALQYIDKEIAITEQEYFSKIINYTENERDLFLSFIEPFDENKITISSLAHSLFLIESNSSSSFVLKDIVDELENDNSISAIALKRLISKSSSPLWRNSHSERWYTSDLIVLKQVKTAERIAGFIKDNVFYITHAFKSHDKYELKLRNSFAKNYTDMRFVEWTFTDDFGQADDEDHNGLIEERDMLLLKYHELKDEINVYSSEISELNEKYETINNENEKLISEIKNLNDKNTIYKEKAFSLEKEIEGYKKQGKSGILNKLKKLFTK